MTWPSDSATTTPRSASPSAMPPHTIEHLFVTQAESKGSSITPRTGEARAGKALRLRSHGPDHSGPGQAVVGRAVSPEGLDHPRQWIGGKVCEERDRGDEAPQQRAQQAWATA